jgi:hypothetical protein
MSCHNRECQKIQQNRKVSSSAVGGDQYNNTLGQTSIALTEIIGISQSFPSIPGQ